MLTAATRAEDVRPEHGGEAESTLLPPSCQVQGNVYGESKGWRGSDAQPRTYVAGLKIETWWESATKYIYTQNTTVSVPSSEMGPPIP